MRILWFTNTPSLASEVLQANGNIGGWIASLEKEVSKMEEIELGIAFHFGYTDSKQFRIGRTDYFSIPYPTLSNGNLKGIISRWKHRIEPSSIVDFYLEIIEKYKPDLIHIFGTEFAYGLIIQRVKVPVIIQIQGNLSVCEKKWFSGLSNYSLLRHSKIKTLIYAYGIWHQVFLLKKRAKREREFMKSCKYIIGRTDWDRRITSILSPQCLYFHCDEVLRPEFYTSKSWLNSHHTKMIFHSTLSSANYKGIETILETAYLLKQDNLFDFEWRVAGVRGNEELIQIIQKKFDRRFIDYGIKFLGSLDPTHLIQVLLESDCYIHPSHIENSPNSVCEAMLLGLPVIATYTGGTPSLIANGIEGLLIQDGDPYSLAGVVVELISDNELKGELSANASRKARERHAPEKVLNDLIDIYNNILLV